MRQPVPAVILTELSQYLAGQMGLHFPPERWNDLERGLAAAAKEFGFDDAESCAGWLLASPLNRQQVETLASHLTVGETYFFREKRSFEILQMELLPGIIRARRAGDQRLRIWSAACCTGEEPYSIAMTLRQMLPDLADWNITILATDINPRFLHKAAEGVYGEWSFRDTPEWVKDRFFRKVSKDRHEIAPEIKEMVTFRHLNLAEDIYPSLLNNTNAMDVIFCRNVLMYFAPGQARKVIMSLHHSLVDGGWLLVSPSEFSHVHVSPFAAVSFPGAIVYRKDLKRQFECRAVAVPAVLPDSIYTLPASYPEPDLSFHFPVPADPGNPVTAPAFQTSPTPLTPYEKAFVCYKQGLYAEAVDILTEVTANPVEPQAVALLARSYADQGRLAEALAACEKAIATDKLQPAYHYLLATILQEKGAHDEARSSLKRAVYLDPRLVVAHFALGNLAHAQGGETEAQRHFANASKLLCACRPDDTLPEADGITAGRLAAIIATMMKKEHAS